MKSIKNLSEKYLNKDSYLALMIVLILVQPILDIDHLLYPLLNSVGLPLPSTIVYLIGYPIMVALAFIIKERNKKRTFIFGAIYLVIVGIYFIAHHLVTKDMGEMLYLPTTYKYLLSTELKYVLSLILPLGLVYAFFKSDMNQQVFDRIVIISSILISFPLFFFNLFAIGPSTYYAGDTLANFPTWFFGVYEKYNPKMLATKFYFSEGNTTGIILFSLYPLLINQLIKAKKKWPMVFLIIIQGIAMNVLATRVATYGVSLMLGTVLGLWLFLVVIRKTRFQIKVLGILGALLMMFYLALPYTPAVVNLNIDNRNDLNVVKNESKLDEWKGTINDEGLVPGSAQFNYYYQHIFEDYYWLLTISNEYYKYFYPYVMDPKFYVDLIFEVDFYDRVSGRQFEEYFFNYKWSKLDSTQKLFGFGYSRFMNGSILLEQDFSMQKYTLGYLGMGLLTFPWLILIAVLGIKALTRFKYLFDLDILLPAVSIASLLGGAYLSGHVLDQYFSTTFLAFYLGYLYHKVNSLGKQ